jgi:protein TonB
VSENRFLQSFCAVAASSVLVCGTLLLLSSTAPWTPPQIGSEPSTPDAAQILARTESRVDRKAEQDALAPVQPDREFEPEADHADRTDTALAAAEAHRDEGRDPFASNTASETPDEALAEPGSPLSPKTADAGEEIVADISTQSAAPDLTETEDLAELASAIAPIPPEKVSTAADQIADLLTTLPPRAFASEQSDSATVEVAEILATLPPAPPPVIAAEKVEPARDEVASKLAELLPALTDVAAAEDRPVEIDEVENPIAALPPSPPAVTAEGVDPAPDEVALLTTDLPLGQAPLVPTEEVKPARDSIVVTVAALPAPPALLSFEEAEPEQDEPVAASTSETAEPENGREAEPVKIVASVGPNPPLPRRKPAEAGLALNVSAASAPPAKATALFAGTVDAGPPPPLPRRKPADLSAEPKVVAPAAPAKVPAQPKAAAAFTPPRERQPAQEEPKQQLVQGGGLRGFWKPMALAPADKPSVPSKAQAARPGNGAYSNRIWAALARHKPRAGQRGSASVSFSIGKMGGLRGVKIARSSGNSRIDQLALQTVRNAAPFPPPPSGAASYTIRIDFQ